MIAATLRRSWSRRAKPVAGLLPVVVFTPLLVLLGAAIAFISPEPVRHQ